MKKALKPKSKAAPKAPILASRKGKPALPPKKAVPSVAKLAKLVVPDKSARKKTVVQKPTASKPPAAKPKKRSAQHDSAYYAAIGQRGGQSLMQQRGPEYYAEIARRSHPRAEYRGGRPKGSTKEKKLKDEAAARAAMKKTRKKAA